MPEIVSSEHVYEFICAATLNGNASSRMLNIQVFFFCDFFYLFLCFIPLFGAILNEGIYFNLDTLGDAGFIFCCFVFLNKLLTSAIGTSVAKVYLNQKTF
jgi:hypothetical protein